MITLRTRGRSDFSAENRNSFSSGKKSITTAGMAEQLPSNFIPNGVALLIKALASNTGKIYLAKSKPFAEDPLTSYELFSGETVSYNISNTNIIWVNSELNGDGVTFTVEVD